MRVIASHALTSTIPRVTILRGTARVLPSMTGLLLVYGLSFALEGMATPIGGIYTNGERPFSISR